MAEPLGLGKRPGLGVANAPPPPTTTAGNEAWASKKAPVGLKLLQKMGWQDGKGLGANEDGRVSHIRVKRKAAAIGIGATAADIQRGWETPGVVANGLNDILAKLSAMATPKPASDADVPVDAADALAETATKTKTALTKDAATTTDGIKHGKDQQAAVDQKLPEKAARKRKGGRGFYERKRALKTVGRYSKQELAEIFGAVCAQDDAPPCALPNIGNPTSIASCIIKTERLPSDEKSDTADDVECAVGTKTMEDHEHSTVEPTDVATQTAEGSVGERASASMSKKRKAVVASSVPGVTSGAVKKSEKKKKKKKSKSKSKSKQVA